MGDLFVLRQSCTHSALSVVLPSVDALALLRLDLSGHPTIMSLSRHHLLQQFPFLAASLPIPLLEPVVKPASCSSQRVRARFRCKVAISQVTNQTLQMLNELAGLGDAAASTKQSDGCEELLQQTVRQLCARSVFEHNVTHSLNGSRLSVAPGYLPLPLTPLCSILDAVCKRHHALRSLATSANACHMPLAIIEDTNSAGDLEEKCSSPSPLISSATISRVPTAKVVLTVYELTEQASQRRKEKMAMLWSQRRQQRKGKAAQSKLHVQRPSKPTKVQQLKQNPLTTTHSTQLSGRRRTGMRSLQSASILSPNSELRAAAESSFRVRVVSPATPMASVGLQSQNEMVRSSKAVASAAVAKEQSNAQNQSSSSALLPTGSAHALAIQPSQTRKRSEHLTSPHHTPVPAMVPPLSVHFSSASSPSSVTFLPPSADALLPLPTHGGFASHRPELVSYRLEGSVQHRRRPQFASRIQELEQIAEELQARVEAAALRVASSSSTIAGRTD